MTFFEGTLPILAGFAALAAVVLKLLISRRNMRTAGVSRSILIEAPRSTTYGGHSGTIRKVSSDPPPFPDITQTWKTRNW